MKSLPHLQESALRKLLFLVLLITLSVVRIVML